MPVTSDWSMGVVAEHVCWEKTRDKKWKEVEVENYLSGINKQRGELGDINWKRWFKEKHRHKVKDIKTKKERRGKTDTQAENQKWEKQWQKGKPTWRGL